MPPRWKALEPENENPAGMKDPMRLKAQMLGQLFLISGQALKELHLELFVLLC